jgi:hypothetical protein
MLRIPGKIFLIGEYGVLEGTSSLLAAVKPGYEFGPGGKAPHPDSPAGVYAREFSIPLEGVPGLLHGAQGFGSSTAELIAVSGNGLDSMERGDLLEWYRSRHPRASGMDLDAQLSAFVGKGNVFSYSGNRGSRSVSAAESASRILVLKTPIERKLSTHEDLLHTRPSLNVSRMETLVLNFTRGFESGQDEGLLAVNEFAEELHRTGRETPFANEVRISLTALPGVLAVKGCGAGMNDAFLVVLNRDAGKKEVSHIRESARSHGLSDLGTLGSILW